MTRKLLFAVLATLGLCMLCSCGQKALPIERLAVVETIYTPHNTVKPGDKVHIQWVTENVGNVDWVNRELWCEDDRDLKTAQKIPLPNTKAGQRCVVDLQVVAPKEIGAHRADYYLDGNWGSFLEAYVLLEVTDHPERVFRDSASLRIPHY